ncbi:MAG TPA: YlmH/Sll1252 family protein, partial [Desulfobacteria bacterium]|nr:YlmH/Sll1252 family protein [Desulfobacteria bacterium]
VVRTHSVEVTEFFDPYQQSIISPVLPKVPGISFIWTGGFDRAERKRLVLFPEYLESEDTDPEIKCLEITGNLKFQDLSHRDFLGSLMGLGIKRDKLGDIIVTSKGCQVVTDSQIAGYIERNLTKVHRVGVHIREIAIDELQLPEEEVREVFATVASMRLDAVAAAGFGVSRTKMADEIYAEKVKVNWLVVNDCSHAVKEGDIISIRGRGRVELDIVKGETKKGRIALNLKRFK